MGGKYKTYSEYKDSGAEWLGSIPRHWQTSKLKYLTKQIVDGAHFTPTYVSEGVPFLRVTDVQSKVIDKSEIKFIPQSEHDELIKRCQPECGDLLLSKNGTIGVPKIVNWDWKFSIFVSLCLIKFTSELDVRFAYFFFLSHEIKEQIFGQIKQSTVINLHLDKIENFVFALPPAPEQKNISRFLDHETAKIDTLIEEQQSLIRLLKEKRQAVVSHAVTKGLPSITGADAPMKDSGVEWLGEVPEHWTIRRLKHTSSHQSGIPKGKDLTGKKTIEVPMLRVANVQDGYLDLTDVHTIKIESEQLERFLLKKGDVLMNEGGDNDKLGRGAVWTGEISPCIHQNHVHVIRPREIEPEWVELLTGSSYAKFHFFRVAKQSTNLASISSSNMKETPLVIPPSDERREIMAYLQKMTGKYDVLETECQQQISLLREHRTALISAAVTGKIDVRDWSSN